MRWRPYTAIVFDCDSTLSAVEGIDVLAEQLGLERRIAALTDAAMNGDQNLADVYGERLALLNPTREQVMALKHAYKAAVVPHARAVIAALHYSGLETWIVSGGLLEPVREFGIWLGVDPSHVRAVGMDFDPLAGSWWIDEESEHRYLTYRTGHLTETTGKGEVIDSSVTSGGRRLMLGDGMSDAAVGDSVDLFVAYAGVVDRPSVTKSAPVVIRSTTLAPLLLLALGPAGVRRLLDTDHSAVALAALNAVEDGGIAFNDTALERSFTAALSSRRGL